MAMVLVDVLDLTTPVSIQGIVLFGSALAGAWFLRPLAPAMLLVAVAGLVVSLLPIGGTAEPHPLSRTELWILAFCVTAAVVQTWGHLLLRRTLGSGAATSA